MELVVPVARDVHTALPILETALHDARAVVELDLHRVERLLAQTRTQLHLGGHRVRPLLVLLSARACGTAAPSAPDHALAAELIHTASLVVHDLLDGRLRRRGGRALHLRGGPRAATLAGTQLVAEAFGAVARTGDAVLVAELSDVVREMTASEGAEADAEGRLAVSAADREALNLSKTGRLIEWSTRAGAHAAGADEGIRRDLTAFGRGLGTAYQHLDDLFDLAADPVLLGKDTFADVARGRMTLPLILGAQRSSRVATLLRQAWSETHGAAARGALRERLREALVHAGAFAATADHVAETIDAATAHLEALAPSDAREALREIADAVTAAARAAASEV